MITRRWCCALYFGSYGLIISGLLPLPWMWFFCFAMGIGMAGIGFSVTHDALHGAYSANPRVTSAAATRTSRY